MYSQFMMHGQKKRYETLNLLCKSVGNKNYTLRVLFCIVCRIWMSRNIAICSQQRKNFHLSATFLKWIRKVYVPNEVTLMKQESVVNGRCTILQDTEKFNPPEVKFFYENFRTSNFYLWTKRFDKRFICNPAV